MKFCACSVYTIQPRISLQRHFIRSHMRRVLVCLAVTCHLHFWQNVRDVLRATAVTRGWNEYRKKSQHRKLKIDSGEEHSPAAPAGTRTRDLSITSPSLYHWAIPTPQYFLNCIERLNLPPPPPHTHNNNIHIHEMPASLAWRTFVELTDVQPCHEQEKRESSVSTPSQPCRW